MKKYRIEAGKRCFSDVPGAVFVSWGSDSGYVSVSPAMIGMKRNKNRTRFSACIIIYTCLTLTDRECVKLYYDAPQKGEAWLVLPGGTGYEWIRIDDQIRV